ncbi:hypothetical protein BOX15_Mlig002747g1 [Macrostomum lignano]|uniref:Protein kinase domain-containing protein n=1 Tax=Macrostomum lignano TaxID=282301 RepID=A0A267ED31_9PLAT|nr:hypothetical protein BOX15_Mlig002747g1 [Macrostomum lignano]
MLHPHQSRSSNSHHQQQNQLRVPSANSGSRSSSGTRQQQQQQFEIPQCAKHIRAGNGEGNKDDELVVLETATATYRLYARIGEGSFGTTHLAVIQTAKLLGDGLEDGIKDRQLLALQTGRSVVVKQIKKHMSAEPHQSESLELHCRNLESMDIVKSISHIKHCDHPFIAKLLDSQYALTTTDRPFEVYEYYAIGDAMNLLDHIAGTDERHREAVNLQTYVTYLSLQVAEALSYLHESGFIHFDLKIDNVLIDEAGDVKLGDFGLAKACALGKAIENPYYYWGSPCSVSVFASIRWVPPEQLEEGSRMVDHSVDWYSLGALMFHMIYGRLPFEEHRAKILESPAATAAANNSATNSDGTGTPPSNDKQLKRSFLKLWRANVRPKVDDRPKVNQRLKNFLYNLLSYESNSRLGKQGYTEVFQRFHGLCRDLDLHWFDSIGGGDVERMRKMLRRRDVARPYRIKLLQTLH